MRQDKQNMSPLGPILLIRSLPACKEGGVFFNLQKDGHANLRQEWSLFIPWETVGGNAGNCSFSLRKELKKIGEGWWWKREIGSALTWNVDCFLSKSAGQMEVGQETAKCNKDLSGLNGCDIQAG